MVVVVADFISIRYVIPFLFLLLVYYCCLWFVTCCFHLLGASLFLSCLKKRQRILLLYRWVCVVMNVDDCLFCERCKNTEFLVVDLVVVCKMLILLTNWGISQTKNLFFISSYTFLHHLIKDNNYSILLKFWKKIRKVFYLIYNTLFDIKSWNYNSTSHS